MKRLSGFGKYRLLVNGQSNRDAQNISVYNSVRWHLATNSFHQHVRLLMEISPHTFFLKKYFDPMEKCVFQ